MFKRAGLTTKYKQYTKSIKTLKTRLYNKGHVLKQHYNLDNVSLSCKVTSCVESIQSAKKSVLASSCIQKYRDVVQNEMDKFKTTELSNKSIQIKNKLDDLCKSDVLKKWSHNRSLFSLGAINLFSTGPASDAVHVTGYTNKSDFELMKHLGITQHSEVVQPNTATEVVQNPTDILNNATNNNTNSSSAYETTNLNNITDSAASDDLFKKLLSENPYTSPFDNMPPMRSDETGFFINIYKTLTGQNDTPSNLNKASNKLVENEPILEKDLSIETNMFEEGNQAINLDETIIEIIKPETEIRFSTYESPPIAPNSSLTESHISPITNNASESLLTTENMHQTITNIPDTDVGPIIENIPEPPPIPDAAAELASQLNVLGEQTFASLGLGGWTPVGMVQNCFEYLHVVLGIPWWEAIAIGTLIIRFAMFPLVVIAQRNAAKMNNHLPQLQVIQLKMTDARQSGNQLEAARYSQELMLFMKEKNLNPFKNMIVPLAQMPIFISFFMGLRQMANVPVDSLRDGGMFWFTDLTVPDQYFALPIITSATLWATIELGTDSAKLSSQNLQTMKYVLRAMPICILPFIVNFPGAILCYWVSSNFISLAQVGFLRIPSVRDYFKIEALVKHNPANLPVKNKGFVGGIKDSWTNLKITKELEDRKRLDDLQFQRAGKGPIVKTYKYDPTKQVTRSPISAKKR